MKPLSLFARIVIASGVTILFIAATVLWTRSELRDASKTVEQLAARSVQGIEFAARLQRLLHERPYVSTYLLTGDPRFLQSGEAPDPVELGAWIEGMDTFVEGPEEHRLLEQMRLRYLAYTAFGDEAVRLAVAGQTDAAHQAFLSMKSEVASFLDESQALFEDAREDMQERQAAATRKLERGHRVLLSLALLGALASFTLAVLLARRAVRPLADLVLRLTAAGGGTLTVRGDELGTLESEVNRLLERVRTQERALQQAEKLSELGVIAAELAHETLNPLAGAKGIVQVVRRTPELPAATVSEELAGVERELVRVENTVQRLVKYAKPLEPHMRTSDVRALVEESVARTATFPSGQSCRIDVLEAPKTEWTLDPELISQVLVNLLVNACEASTEAKSAEPIQLAVTQTPSGLTFEVRDRGVGTLPAQRERLFRPFFSTKPKGNGLGLAVSRNIVLEHGGQMEAEPREGGGSVFRFQLPKESVQWPRAS